MKQTNIPAKKAVKYTYWLITASTINNNTAVTLTVPFRVDAIFFKSKVVLEYLNKTAKTSKLQWNILFCMQLTKEQYKIYTDENL